MKACLANGDDTVKKVSLFSFIPQCLSIINGNVRRKSVGCFISLITHLTQIQKAYDKCFGKDYSFDDLADTVGRDSDNDDLPDEYEGADVQWKVKC